MAEKIYNEEYLSSELAQLNSEINAMEDLYQEIKDHYDLVRNAGYKGSLTFVERQTTNLVGIRTAKLNLIKEKLALKKNIVDFRFKEANLNKDIDSSTAYNPKEVLEEILNQLKHEDAVSNQEELANSEDVDNELDSIIEENNIDVSSIIEGDQQIKDENNSEIVNYDFIVEGLVYAVEIETNEYYTLNSAYQIVEELGKNYDTITKIENINKDDQMATGKSGKKYLVISFE